MARPTNQSKIDTKSKKIKIANTEVVIGDIYEIQHKYDGNAPDGMKSISATKFPLVGVADSSRIYFDEKRNTYDTGFYVNSLCNSDVAIIDGKEELVKQYVKLIKEPYEEVMNVDCSETNHEFWGQFYTIKAHVNKAFNTSDPVDLFELFHLLKQAIVCNPGEKNPVLQKASYTIKNIAQKNNQEDEVITNKYTAVSNFDILLKSDIEKLYTLLEYNNMPNPRKMEKEVLRTQYFRIFESKDKGSQFVKQFLDSFNKYDSKDGKVEMEYFTVAQKLLQKGAIERIKTGLYTKDGEYLANTTKDIGIKAINDGEFRSKINMLAEEYLKE